MSATIVALSQEGNNQTVAPNFEDDDGLDFNLADLRASASQGVDLSGVEMIGSNWAGANLQNANLSRANCDGANFDDADLAGTDFTCTDIRGATFYGASIDAGLKLVGTSPILTLGPIVDQYLTAYNTTGGIFIRFGDFFGGIPCLKEAVRMGLVELPQVEVIVQTIQAVWNIAV